MELSVFERLDGCRKSEEFLSTLIPQPAAYRAVDNYVYQRVQHFLRRRQKVQSRGTRFSDEVAFVELRALRLRDV